MFTRQAAICTQRSKRPVWFGKICPEQSPVHLWWQSFSGLNNIGRSWWRLAMLQQKRWARQRWTRWGSSHPTPLTWQTAVEQIRGEDRDEGDVHEAQGSSTAAVLSHACAMVLARHLTLLAKLDSPPLFSTWHTCSLIPWGDLIYVTLVC